MKVLALHNGSQIIGSIRSVPGASESEVQVLEANSLQNALVLLANQGDIDLILVSIACARARAARWNSVIRARGIHIPTVFVPDTRDLAAVAGAVLDQLVICPLDTVAGRNVFSSIIIGINRQRELKLARSQRQDLISVATGSSVIGSPAVKTPRLTKRQTQVLQLILEGLTNKDIARELDLAEGTVKIHSIAIYRELGVSNRTQAALRAKQLFAA